VLTSLFQVQVPGIYRGIVKRNDDPSLGRRVTLRIPQILGTAESAWAETTDPNGILPAIGSLVWVMFLGGDITKPVYTANGSQQLTSDIQNLINQITGGTIRDTTIPKSPTFLTGSSSMVYSSEGVGSASLLLAWTAPTENTDNTTLLDLKGYIITWSYDGTHWSGGSFSPDPTWTVRGLTPGASVQIRVIAFSLSGNTSANTPLTVTLITNPGAPSGTPLYPGTGWVPPTLGNSWSNLGSGNQVAAYQLLANGTLEIHGVITGGTTGTPIFNLPIGTRPTAREPFTGQSGTGSCSIEVLANGNVQVVSYNTGGSNASVSLCGIHFSINT
jgi:hypothetical protein